MTNHLDDPLLNALVFFGKVHSQPVNPYGAVQGLPLVEGRLTPELFTRAASKCGFESRMLKRSLKQIHGATLPVLLVLKDNDSVILTRTGNGKNATAEVIVLSSGNGSQEISMDELAESYSGVAILVKPEFKFENRSDFASKTLGKHWFWSTLWGFRSFYARVGLATLMINLLALTSSIFIMTVYDRVVPNKAVDTLMVLAIGVGVAYLFEFALKMLRAYFVDRAGHRIDMKLGSELYARMLGMQFANRPSSAGALASQARSYESLREFFTSATLAALVDLPFIYFFAFIIYLLGGGMVVLPLLAGIGLTLFVGAVMQIPISRAVNNSYNSANQRQALVVEGIQALETVKTTRSESELQSRMEESVRIAAKNDGIARGFSQFALNSTGLISHMVSMFIVIMAFYQVMEGNMSMGAMIACVMLTGRAMAPMAMVASLLSRMQQSRRALKGINQIMDMPVERGEAGNQYISVTEFVPEIRSHDAKFSYSPDSEPVVKDLNFEIKPGEKVAILGRIGSGKSTLLRMVMGLYHPTEGRIDASGIDLRQLDPITLRMNTGYVPQNPTLLYGTIRSNLKAGCPWVDDTEMLNAAERAGLMDFIRSLPEGVEYPVSEGGNTLSGGQRQALSVARAIIEEPRLLVLDEPTSAMDLSSERRLLKCLKEYLAENSERTLIIATHKRSVLGLVDRIIVMEGGRIIADGPRDSVLKNSPYAPLSETQPRSGNRTGPQSEDDIALPG
ncbi:MAG: type I secretion system permease/ATPase [Verrucomicrobiales bacterium]|nr:type I secretion system permease/ATPase [Verrucomicrobiales bacterium]